jgi:hypothetical protein
MTPAELAQGWTGGLPRSGTIQLRLAPWAIESDEFRAVITENIDILADGLSRGLGVFQDGYSFKLTPLAVTRGVWPIRFTPSTPTTDALAYCMNGIAALLKDIDAPWYTNLQIQPDSGEMVAHCAIVPQRSQVPLLGSDLAPLSQRDIVMRQGQCILVQLPSGEFVDETKMQDALFAIGDLVDVGCFDLPVSDFEYELTTPFIGLSVDEKNPQVGLEGFRGVGDLAPVLLAAVEKVFGAPLLQPLVMIRTEDGE